MRVPTILAQFLLLNNENVSEDYWNRLNHLLNEHYGVLLPSRKINCAMDSRSSHASVYIKQNDISKNWAFSCYFGNQLSIVKLELNVIEGNKQLLITRLEDKQFIRSCCENGLSHCASWYEENKRKKLGLFKLPPVLYQYFRPVETYILDRFYSDTCENGYFNAIADWWSGKEILGAREVLLEAYENNDLVLIDYERYRNSKEERESFLFERLGAEKYKSLFA